VLVWMIFLGFVKIEKFVKVVESCDRVSWKSLCIYLLWDMGEFAYLPVLLWESLRIYPYVLYE